MVSKLFPAYPLTLAVLGLQLVSASPGAAESIPEIPVSEISELSEVSEEIATNPDPSAATIATPAELNLTTTPLPELLSNANLSDPNSSDPNSSDTYLSDTNLDYSAIATDLQPQRFQLSPLTANALAPAEFSPQHSPQHTDEPFPPSPERQLAQAHPLTETQATLFESFPPENLDNLEHQEDSLSSSRLSSAQLLLDRLHNPDNPTDPLFAQITPLQQLIDVRPTDWAYQALRSLADRYGCVAGYPDATFRGNRAISRYEAAALVNACLDTVNDLIARTTADLASQDDLAILQRLQSEFATELAALKEQVGELEDRVAELENNRFANRTKLIGVAEFVMQDAFGGENISFGGANQGRDTNTTVSGNVFLDLDTRLGNQSLVRAELFVSNVNAMGRADTGTDMTRVDFLPTTTNDNNPNSVFPQLGEPTVDVTALYYQTPFAGRGLVRIGPVGIITNQMIPDLSPVRALSRFGRRSPIYRSGNGAGAMATYQFNSWFGAAAAYTVGGRSAADSTAGFFANRYRVFTQATFTPNDRLAFALAYQHYYDPGDPVSITAFIGGRRAQAPFGNNTATSADTFSLHGNYRLTDRVSFGGWVNYTLATAESSGRSLLAPPGNDVSEGDNASVWTWAVALNIQSLLKRGSQLGFVFGMPPKLTDTDVARTPADPDTSYHAEVFYRYPITRRISVSPGFFTIFNPEHNSDNDAIFVGIVRTTFVF